MFYNTVRIFPAGVELNARMKIFVLVRCSVRVVYVYNYVVLCTFESTTNGTRLHVLVFIIRKYFRTKVITYSSTKVRKYLRTLYTYRSTRTQYVVVRKCFRTFVLEVLSYFRTFVLPYVAS